jgi:hypothetical protein
MPTIPLGSNRGAVIDGCGTALIAIVSVFCTACGVGVVESWTLKIGATVCIVVGVPLITPAVLRLKPDGSADEPAVRLQA